MYVLIKHLNAGLERVLRAIIFILFAAMVTISFSQVVTRFFHYPLYWSEEMARYIAIWLTFLGASYAYRRKSLALVEALLGFLTPRQKKILGLAIACMVVGFCLFLCVYGVNLTLRAMRQTSPAMFIPMGYVYASAPVSGALMILFCLEHVFEELCGSAKEAK